ncbi:MAG: ribonuclease III domain-containing protein [Clostridia bacterium]
MFKDFKNANVKPNEISANSLAFLGDSVYSEYIREKLILSSKEQAGKLHRKAIKYVSAKSQAISMHHLIEIDFLSEEEFEAYKRGRNTNCATVPKNVDVLTYKVATGFESLVGYLYCLKRIERLEEIMNESVEAVNKELNIK